MRGWVGVTLDGCVHGLQQPDRRSLDKRPGTLWRPRTWDGSLSDVSIVGGSVTPARLVGESEQSDKADRVTPINGSLHPWRRAGRPHPAQDYAVDTPSGFATQHDDRWSPTARRYRGFGSIRAR
jgi:hypothetical protein